MVDGLKMVLFLFIERALSFKPKQQRWKTGRFFSLPFANLLLFCCRIFDSGTSTTLKCTKHAYKCFSDTNQADIIGHLMVQERFCVWQTLVCIFPFRANIFLEAYSQNNIWDGSHSFERKRVCFEANESHLSTTVMVIRGKLSSCFK